jgi:Caspase domain/WD domain, G-beta repeat
LWLTAAGSPASARDLGAMSGEEITVLQQRLANAGCYAGAIDGKANATLQKAVKACPDQEPTLRIETGMHVSQLSNIAVDARCTLAATGSDDKTVRLWSMPDGKPLRVQRLPIDSGAGGKVATVAVSPDGAWIAAGLDDTHSLLDTTRGIYLFDAKTGASVRRIGAIDDAFAVSLAFSPDGRRLAAATTWGGLRVFDVASGALAFRDQPARRSSGYGIAYGADGALFAVGEFGWITRYEVNLRRSARVKAPHQGAFSIAVEPNGRRIAVGYNETPMLDLFDAHTLRWLGTTDLTGANGDLAAVAWSSDGQRLLGGGKFSRKVGKDFQQVVRTWNADGRMLRDNLIPVSDPLANLNSCGDATAFATFETGFGLLRPDGAAIFLRESRAPIMELKVGDALMVSSTGTRVDFGLGFSNERPVIFDVSAGTLADAPPNPAGFAKPLTQGLPMKNWALNERPEFAGKPFALEANEISSSLAIRADLTGLVLGTRAYIRRLDASGRQVWENQGPGAVWGVNLAKNDQLIVAAYSDGTIRWRRWSDGAELLALFVDAKDRRWVAWTPTGYYMASPGGEDLIGWQLNRGWEQQADFFPASRFRDRFNRPDIVRLVLETLDEGAAVLRADQAARRREDVSPLGAKLPPVIRIEPPPDQGRFSSAQATLGYGLRAPSGLVVDRIDVLIDGRPAKEIGRPLKPLDANTETLGSLEIDLPPRDVEIGLIAWSGDIASEAVRVKLSWTGPKPAEQRVRKLHALVAGISDYASPEMALGYAAKDARDFAAALQRQKGGYYADVDVELLVDREVTRASLVSGLEWLEKQTPGEDDVSVLFLAGHGLTDEKQTYWFLPSDASEDEARAKGVSQSEIRETLQGLSGKVLWFLDTCHAGGATRPTPVDVTELVNRVTSAESGGIVAFASSTGREVSVESSTWNNGAFTKAIVEGIDLGKADLFGEGKITTSELDAFVAKRVGELTEQKQHPVMGRPPQEPDFEIAAARKP